MFDPTKLVRPCIQRRKAYIPGKPLEAVQREYGLTDIIKLASNENPLGTSPLAREAMIDEIRQRAYRYPESQAPRLRTKLAERHGLSPEGIVLDNGEDAVILLIAMTFFNPGDEIVMPEVSFVSFANHTINMDATPIKIPMRDDYGLDVEAMAAAITPETKALFICNPNNPTGMVTSKAAFETLLAAVPEDLLVVSDEAYWHFVDDPDYPDTVPYLDDHPNLLILRTFSKAYGLAGLRIGYVLGHPELIQPMSVARPVFAVNRIAQAGALAAMDDEAFLKRVLETNRAGRQQFYRAFEALGLGYVKSQSNFILVDVGRPSNLVAEALLQQGVIVRPQPPDLLPNMIRVSVGTKAENEKAIQALKRVLGSG